LGGHRHFTRYHVHLCIHTTQVPFHVTDDQLGDDWECAHNAWDALHATCDADQVLPDHEIDAALQAGAAHVGSLHAWMDGWVGGCATLRSRLYHC
jgi:hypothetical protein